MKIKKLETFTKPFVSFVKTTLEDGSVGFGQMSTYHADITVKIAALVGKNFSLII